MTKERKFQPGFRLSKLDIAVLVLGALGGVYAETLDRWFGVAVAFVLLHFFLFCNVLRMSRPLELTWAGVFVGTATAAVTSNVLSWQSALAISFATTLVVAAIEIRRPSYHGVGWQRLNPHLPEWWKSAGGAP